MTSSVGALVEHGVDILSTVVDAATNRILAYLGDVKAQAGDSDRAKWVQHVGFASRPGKPTAKKAAAQAVIIRRSDGDVVIGSSDARTLEMYQGLGNGETALFAAGPDGTSQGRVLIKGDGSVTIYTTDDNTGTGHGVTLRIAPDEFSFYAPWGKFVFDKTGVHIVSTTGARFDLGSIGGIPFLGSVLGLQSYANIQADMVSCRGPLVKLGTGTYMTALVGVAGVAGTPSAQVMIGTG